MFLYILMADILHENFHLNREIGSINIKLDVLDSIVCFFFQLVKYTNYSLKAKKTLENTHEKSVLQLVPTIIFGLHFLLFLFTIFAETS